MSNAALSWAFDLELPSTQKLVLLCLANRADENGECFPGQERICRDTSLSPRAVRNALKSMEAAGILSRRHRQRGDGSRTSDSYILAIPNRHEVPHGQESYRHEMPVAPLSNRHEVPGLPARGAGHETKELNHTRIKPKETREGAFDEWWAAYPHKVGKGAADKAFAKAIKIADLQTLLAGVERYRATKPPDRSWCNPSTWLNQERWLDQPDHTPETRNANTSHSRPTRQSGAEQAVRILAEMSGDWDDRPDPGPSQTLDGFGAPPDRGGTRGELIDLVAIRGPARPQQSRSDDAGTIPPGFGFGGNATLAD